MCEKHQENGTTGSLLSSTHFDLLLMRHLHRWWLLYDHNWICFAFQRIIQEHCIDDNKRDHEWTKEEQPQAQRENCAEKHNGPVKKDTTDQQDNTDCGFASDQPADSKYAQEGKENFGGEGTVVFCT